MDGLKRVLGSRGTEDATTIENIEYNSYSGGQKNLSVGPALEYIGELTADTQITPGSQLYIFKATAGLGYVTLSDAGSVAVGTAPAAGTFPVFGQEYTLISADQYKVIIGAAGIHLYVLKDESSKLKVNA